MVLLGSPLSILVIIGVFILKHFLCDFVFRDNELDKLTPKDNFCLKIEHGLIHGIGTGIIVFIFTTSLSLACIFLTLDLILHYLIDYSITRLYERSSDTQSRSTWVMVGIDQVLHYCCYLIYVLILLFVI